MAMEGLPRQNAVPLAELASTPARMGIAYSSWHERIIGRLLGGARRACAAAGCEVVELNVQGSFELPIAAKALAETCDAVVGIGVVIRGQTPHFDFIAHSATEGLQRVALDSGKPVGNAVLTCDTAEQAEARAGLAGSVEDTGYAAAEAAIRAYAAIAEL